MYLSAASFAMVALFATDAQSLGVDEKSVYDRISPSIVTVVGGGPAALIDQRGWFLAHSDGIPPMPNVVGRDQTGRVIMLRVLAGDEVTKLVLLEATQGWVPGQASPIKLVNPASRAVQNAKPEASVRLIAVGPNGPFRAEISASNRIGITGPARRGVTLNELRYESIAPNIAGSLLFNPSGELVGIFTATLETPETLNNQRNNAKMAQQADLNKSGGFGGGGNAGGGPANVAPGAFMAAPNYGPQSMSVSYSVTPDILDRVVDGFLSPNHKVHHPTLGLLCREMPQGGAQIFSVNPSSGAQLAGLKAGDVIVQIGEVPVQTVGDFTRAVLRLRVGTTVQVKVRRGNAAPVDVPVRVGS